MWAAWSRGRRSPGSDGSRRFASTIADSGVSFTCEAPPPSSLPPPSHLPTTTTTAAAFRWCLAQALATGFHRFLARFSGRRRPKATQVRQLKRGYPPSWTLLVLVVSSLLSITDACSSRTTPKPRPPAPTPRPNITFHTFECPPAYAAWYCLNGATCFTVKIGESLLYNCECTEGYMGPRCEYKDLDGSYMPSQRGFMLETASIAGGAAIAVLLVVILGLALYVNYWRRNKAARTSSDCIDGCSGVHRIKPTFGTRSRVASSSDPSRLPKAALFDKHSKRRSSNRAVDRYKSEELQQITTFYNLQPTGGFGTRACEAHEETRDGGTEKRHNQSRV